MHALVRSTLAGAAAALLAACHPAAPASSPLPSVASAQTAPFLPVGAPHDDAQRLTAARDGLRLQTQRANGTRTALIVAGVAALAIVIVVLAGSTADRVY